MSHFSFCQQSNIVFIIYIEAILVAWVMGKTREEIGNIMEMTWEINVFIIIASNTVPWLRPLASVAKMVK